MSSPKNDLAADVIRDLLKSCWIIEGARAQVYSRWSQKDEHYRAAGARAEERQSLIAEALSDLGHGPDPDLVAGHTAWITNLVGDRADDVPLGPIFLARLGDWIEGHGSGFFGERATRVSALGDEERSSVRWPQSLPDPPAFERVPTIEVEPPGKVRFRFAILGDLHIGSPAGESMARAAVSDLNTSGAEFVVQLGDITDHGAKDEFDLAAEILRDLQMPVHPIMGNHDVLSLTEGTISGKEYFKTTFGREPDGKLFEHDGVNFALLDSVEHAASPFPPYNLVTGAFVEGPSGAIVRGALSYPQHDLLADVAGPGGGPAFVFLHHPPQPFVGFPPIIFGLRAEDSGRLHAVADSGNVWGIFAGHTHRSTQTRTYGDVPVMEVAIPRDYPYGYVLVDVTDRGYAYRFVQLSDTALLRKASESASTIHRRYGLGRDEHRSFVWER